MKKFYFFTIFTFLAASTLYGQYYKYISLGYNKVELKNAQGGSLGKYYFLLNDERFPNMCIEDAYDNILLVEVEHHNLESRFEGRAVTAFWPRRLFFTYTIDKEGYTPNDGYDRKEIYRVVNGKLAYVLKWDAESEKIQYSDTDLTVTMKSQCGKYPLDFIIHFSNIPQDELYSLFMRRLVSCMNDVIQSAHKMYVNWKDYDENLGKITKTELELFKECLFRRHGYVNPQTEWARYVSTWGKERGSYLEALESFSGYELKLLEIVQKHLSGESFGVGDFYRTRDRLRLRDQPNLSSNTITTMDYGQWVIILERGITMTIDDITSSWVKVKTGSGLEGWCFGGYLE